MRISNLFITISLLLVAGTLGYTQQKSLQCGQWRQDVKTLTDKGGASLLNANPVVTDFDHFLDAQAPRSLDLKSTTDKTQHRFPSEKEVVEIDAYITTITFTEDEHNFRMVLRSQGSEHTMFAELPNPDCQLLDRFPAQRAQFSQTWKELSGIMDRISKDSKPVKVKITGVRFWDAPGIERGESASGAEICPILKVTW
jgi:hypothetical protein